MASTMKAWQWASIQDKLEKSLTLNESAPSPSKSNLSRDQLLIKIITAAINPVDYKLPESGWIGSLMIRGRPATPGLDFCGRIIAKHSSNDAFQEGELVFGALAKATKFGSLSEFLVVSVHECARLPDGVTPDQGAAVGCAGTTAFQSVPSEIVKSGSKVFINGGSGGVGSFAIQFAKALSADVTTTCSTTNVELCRTLGADHVIDYKKTDVLKALIESGQVFDLAVDNVGDPSLSQNSKSFLKEGGSFMQVGISVRASDIVTTFAKMLWPSNISYRFIQMKNDSPFFSQIGQWMAEGKVRPVIDEAFAFEDAPKAYEKLRTGRAKGKIIIHVENKSEM
ncbi:zinc-binding oxidoreductase [Annulohypoxylon nitens]|nr:zinc-binding oxidoreductase [Annulohypoxylon nitens]